MKWGVLLEEDSGRYVGVVCECRAIRKMAWCRDSTTPLFRQNNL